jgi:hypothetical protein
METHFENGPVYPIPVAPDSWALLLARLARSLWCTAGSVSLVL